MHPWLGCSNSVLLEESILHWGATDPITQSNFYSIGPEGCIKLAGWLHDIYGVGGFLCQHNRSDMATDASEKLSSLLSFEMFNQH